MQTLTKLNRRVDIGAVLNELGLLGQGVELGVFRGDFAEQLLSTWKGGPLLLIDAWLHLPDYFDSWNLSDKEMEGNYHVTRHKLAGFTQRTQFFRMRSEVAATIVAENSCDFIHIDANHSYLAVTRDLQMWYPKLRIGGLMSGHDYFDAEADESFEPILVNDSEPMKLDRLTSYGVKSAVDHFVRGVRVELSVTCEQLPTWYFIKT
jgi:hypothetical protein